MGEKNNLRKLVGIAAVLYMLLLGVLAVLWHSDNSPMPSGLFILWPYAGVRTVLRTFSVVGWAEIYAGILLFIPIGVLWPAANRKLRRLWLLFPAALAVGTVWELLRFASGMGSFVADNLVGHVFGVLVGYGFYRIAARYQALRNSRRLVDEIQRKNSYKESKNSQYLLDEVNNRTRLLPVLLLQLPLVALVIFFAVVFVRYAGQKYGNLNCMYASRTQLSDTKITVRGSFSGKRQRASVYRAAVYDRETGEDRCRQILKDAGYDMGSSRVSGGSVCCGSSDGAAELWMELIGGEYTLTDYSRWKEGESGKAGLEESGVRRALSEWKISVPAGGTFEELGKGSYVFAYENVVENGRFFDGNLVCVLDREGRISRADVQLPGGQYVGSEEIISEQEAYEMLISGRFEAVGFESGRGIVIMELKRFRTGYSLDSKGFYQPIYRADMVINGRETEVDIPALAEDSG